MRVSRSPRRVMTTLWATPVFGAGTAIVVAVAPRMARVSDTLASQSAVGSALFDAIFLGASTSLPGIVVTVLAAARGDLDLAAANAIGGIEQLLSERSQQERSGHRDGE